VERLSSDLKRKGIKIWLYQNNIKVGDSIIDKIEKGLLEQDFLGIVLSPNSVNSAWVKKELNAGLIREINENFSFILPILIKKCKIPPLISDKKYADFRKNYEMGFDDLLQVLLPKETITKKTPEIIRETEEKDIHKLLTILNNPFSNENDKNEAFEKIIELKTVYILIQIYENVWTPYQRKLKALNVISENPLGNENYLYSIIENPFSSIEEQEISLEGLLRANSEKYLNELLNGVFTPSWIIERISSNHE